MKRIYLFLVAGLISLNTFAEVDRISVYFKQGTDELVDVSQDQINRLKKAYENFEIQIIELSSFSGNIQPAQALKESNLRTSFLLEMLAISDEPVTIYNWGRQRPALNFIPDHWDRVDVYYHKSTLRIVAENTKKILKSKQVENTVPTMQDEQVATVQMMNNDHIEREKQKFYLKEFTYNPDMQESDAMVLPILFVGNKAIIKKRSVGYLDKLHQLLEEQPELSVHIRGHVCCGNRKMLSRRRARAVYRELKDLGVSKDRMTFQGYGNTEPFVFPERSSHDRSLNRRVDVIFSSKNTIAENTQH